MRRLGAVVVAAAAAWAGSVAAAGAPQVRFPRDHFGHPASSIEWWYFTALVRDRTGTRYSVFFTLFSSRGVLVPVAQVRNLETGEVVGQSERLASARVSPSRLDLRVRGAALQYLPATNTWHLSVSAPGLQLALRQQPEKPYVLHGGGTGLIRQSVAGPSHYYSDTRMRASGALRVGGRTLAVGGQGWFDHQWGDFADDPRAFDWDWFSCRFDDRTELMLYQFLDRRTGRPLAELRNGTFVGRAGRSIRISAFTAEHDREALTAAGHRWPLDWQLRVPTLGLAESVHALLPDQLVRTSILPTFWEGAARATGTRTGACFVEISYR